MNRYQPNENTDHATRIVLARRCGEELHPEDPAAAWIDNESNDVIDAYHEGLERQYEEEPW